MTVACDTLDGSDARSLVDKARAVCMAINSLRRGVPVEVRTAA